MADKTKYLTTSEYAKKAGITASTVSKMLRNGKLKGTKKSGKWLVNADQLDTQSGRGSTKASKPAPSKKTAKSKKSVKSTAKTYSIEEFSNLTYLTEVGVKRFIKEGRLKAIQDKKGNWCVEADSLEAPGIKNLVR